MIEFYRKHEEKIKYLFIGLWNTLVGYLTFIVLYYLLNYKFNYLIILIFSNIISITNSYLCYKFFVFKTKGNYRIEYMRFYLIYGASFLANMVLMPFFVEIAGMQPIPAQGIILIFSVLFGYLGHKHYSFGASGETLKRAFSGDENRSEK